MLATVDFYCLCILPGVSRFCSIKAGDLFFTGAIVALGISLTLLISFLVIRALYRTVNRCEIHFDGRRLFTRDKQINISRGEILAVHEGMSPNRSSRMINLEPLYKSILVLELTGNRLIALDFLHGPLPVENGSVLNAAIKRELNDLIVPDSELYYHRALYSRLNIPIKNRIVKMDG